MFKASRNENCEVVCWFVCLFVCLFAYTAKLLLIDDLVLSGLGILEKKAKFSKMRVTLMAV